MKLYDCQMAPNPRRVRVFLAEKGVDIPKTEVSIIEGENLKPEYLAVNPRGLLPTLELDDGSRIDETIAICRYIEETQPEPNLMGRDALEKARIESWQRHMEFDGLNPTGEMFRNSFDPFKKGIMHLKTPRTCGAPEPPDLRPDHPPPELFWTPIKRFDPPRGEDLALGVLFSIIPSEEGNRPHPLLGGAPRERRGGFFPLGPGITHHTFSKGIMHLKTPRTCGAPEPPDLRPDHPPPELFWTPIKRFDPPRGEDLALGVLFSIIPFKKGIMHLKTPRTCGAPEPPDLRPDHPPPELFWTPIKRFDPPRGEDLALGVLFSIIPFKNRGLPGLENVQAIPELAARGKAGVERFYERLEQRLSQSAYVAGERYTIADITALCVVDFASFAKMGIPEANTNTKRWHADVSSRPSAKA